MSEQQQPSGKDEKGLTLSGRTILRIMIEFNKVLSASRQIGDNKGFELIQTPTVLLELKSLLWIAQEMAKRIGDVQTVETYLKAHFDEDRKVVREGLRESGKELVDELLAMAGIPKCQTCGHLVCPICNVCHNCDRDKSHGFDHSMMGLPGSRPVN